MPVTPLLLLLDGVLSQDEQRTREAVQQIYESNIPGLPIADPSRLLSSATTLEQVVASLMKHRPEWAAIASQRDGSLPLHFAASIGSIPLARFILDANRQAALEPNQKGKIPLHYAAREGRVEMVNFFMQESPTSASILSRKDKLALHFAAREGHVDVVRALLKVHPQGSTITSKKGKIALHFAARWGHIDVARELLDCSPDMISVLDYEGSSPMHDAARDGQTEMMKFLVKLWPKGLSQENLRGETPLFPAVLSGNLELVNYMVRAWPSGGRSVLQQVGDADGVSGWSPDMLELCLRGAVNIWKTEENVKDVVHSAQGEELEPGQGHVHSKGQSEACEQANSCARLALKSSGTTSSLKNSPSNKLRTGDESEDESLDIHLPRCKSPVLIETARRLKSRPRSGSTEVGDCLKKKKQKTCASPTEFDEILSELRTVSGHRSFLELHAALECGASAPVLACVLDRFGETQIGRMDELGRLPLHVAIGSKPAKDKEKVVDLILKRIWEPRKDASFHRDYLGCLPLHRGLMNRADPRMIKALLESNPSSAVDQCEILDARFMHSSPIAMASACGCPLSTIYMLVRADPSVASLYSGGTTPWHDLRY